MNTMLFVLPLVVVLLLAAPLVSAARGNLDSHKMRNRVMMNLGAFGLVCILATALPLGGLAFADTANVVGTIVGTNAQGMGFLAAALVTGLAALGAGIAVAAAAPAAIGAVSEDPKAFGKAIIFVVLGEGIAIYGLLISILIINKL